MHQWYSPVEYPPSKDWVIISLLVSVMRKKKKNINEEYTVTHQHIDLGKLIHGSGVPILPI